MQVPRYQVDPAWSKPLPNHWLVGAVVGVVVDAKDHVWITHRPPTLQPNATLALEGGAAGPRVRSGRHAGVVMGRSGPGRWPSSSTASTSITRTMCAGKGATGRQILKFTAGQVPPADRPPGKNRGSNDTENLGGTANMVVDAPANELYVADGYVNHRVIVFDGRSAPTSGTGAPTARSRTTAIS